MKHSKSGIKISVFQQKKSHVSTAMKTGNVITSGNTAQAHVVHVLKSIMTVGKNMVVEILDVRLAAIVTDLWKFGTTYLHSSTAMAKATT